MVFVAVAMTDIYKRIVQESRALVPDKGIFHKCTASFFILIHDLGLAGDMRIQNVYVLVKLIVRFQHRDDSTHRAPMLRR